MNRFTLVVGSTDVAVRKVNDQALKDLPVFEQIDALETNHRAAVAHANEPVRGGVMGSEAMQWEPTEFGKLVNIQEAENQIAPIRPSQPVLDFCPSPNRHFFCGMARKLGCHFCATK